jgi:hypothetical protein
VTYPADFDDVQAWPFPGIEESARADHEHLLKEKTDALRWLMADVKGRRIVRDVLEHCGVRHANAAFEPAGAMAFVEGRRDVGLWLESQVLEASPKGYIEMLTEMHTPK